jgi:uncharacterized protein YkwD
LRGVRQIIMQILSSVPFSRNRLCAVAAALLLIVSAAGFAEARETYVQYAERILADPPAGVTVRTDLEAGVLRATNAYLGENGLKPLKKTGGTLLTAARAQAMDLLIQGGMGHVSSTGHDFEARLRAFHPGQMFLTPMAENAARLRNSELSDSAKAQALVQQWIKSSGHRKNMVNRTYVSIAIGVVSRGKDVYAVQIFSGPVVKTNLMGNLN